MNLYLYLSLSLYVYIHTTRLDLAPYGIRVNAISPALIGPGYMWSRQNELHASCGSPYFPKDPEAVAQSKIAR